MVLGINTEGKKEVLSLVIGENESSKYWLTVLNSLKNRGIQDILILCSDGLSRIKEAITTAYPETEQQRCIVHMVRNTLKYGKQRHERICQRSENNLSAVDEEAALEQLERVKGNGRRSTRMP